MKYYVESYGCTMNQGETEMLADDYSLRGHQRVDTPEEADEVIIGTCVVITKTENRMKRRIKELSEICDSIVVSGCLTTTDNPCPGTKLVIPKDIPMTLESNSGSTIGVIPISSGCIGRCAYCITKIARGQLRSRPVDDIVKKFQNMVASGVKEVRISCQDTASYGLDIDTDIIYLLRKLTDIKGDHRIRIGMMNPDTAATKLDELKTVMESDKIYKFIHLPLQSGSDQILQSMNRRYTVEEWISIVKELRIKFPYLTLSTDMIVGFPGESEDDFEKTKEVLERIQPDIVNITRFSPRPGTTAAKLKDKVHSSIKKERSKELTSMHMKMSRDINEGYVGRQMKVLMLERGKYDSITGRTDDYKVVVVKNADENILGHWIDVKITKASEVYLLGERI